MQFASLPRTRFVRPVAMLFTAATLVLSLNACVTGSKGGDALSWRAGAPGGVAGLESLVSGGGASARAQVAHVEPRDWKAVTVSGSYAIVAHNNAAVDFGRRLRDRGVEHVATALTGGMGDFTANRAGIRQALESLSGGQGACLFFATSHGNLSGLRLEAEAGRGRVLSPGELDRLLDQHCGDRPTVAILSDCDAGVFLDSRMRQPNRILIAASSRGRTSYGAKLYERHVNFDRCLMGAIDAGASTWRDAFQRTLPCVRERETWLGVRGSEPQAYFGANVANLSVPGAPRVTAQLK